MPGRPSPSHQAARTAGSGQRRSDLQVGAPRGVLGTIDKVDFYGELERLRAALRASGDVFYDWDLATDDIAWLGDVAGLLGASAARLPRSGEELHARINPEDLPWRMRALSDHMAGSGEYDCEYRLRGDEGAVRWVHDRGAVTFSPAGAPVRMAGSLRLITARKDNEARLEYLASYDDLTGHYNKLRLRESLDHSIAHAIRFEQPGAFMTVGIDQLGTLSLDEYAGIVSQELLVEPPAVRTEMADAVLGYRLRIGKGYHH